jgi:aarF domain-containing kinase
MLKLAQTMFDTKLPPGVKMLQPFSEESSIKKIAVQVHSRVQISYSTFVSEITHP